MNGRCRSICGSDAADNCFINNKKQIACIADIVINKVFAITSTIELALQQCQNDKINECLNKVLTETQELVNWVKFLQIAHDIKTFVSLFDKSPSDERRRETRFPLPEVYQTYVVLKINISGVFVPATIVNFSQRGLQFKSPEPVEINTVVECKLVTTRTFGKEVSFKLRVRHCTKHGNEFIIGAQIEEIADSTSFNFFRNVHDFILGILLKQ